MTLEDFILNLSWESLPEKTRHIAKLCVLDALGCAVSGSRCDGLARHIESLSPDDGSASELIWGTRLRTRLETAIFFNAHTAAYFDMDDGHRRAQGHPGATIIPAALVTACHFKRSGRAFLEAVVVGYEIATRSALMIRSQGGPRKGSGGWAVIGAAAACARLMGCSTAETLNAIGLAEYYAPQAPQDRSAAFPSEMKEGIAWGAMTGFSAARLAAGGFTAMRPLLADSEFIADLGENYETDRVYFKTYASCRWAHPALDALKTMQQRQERPWSTIAEIRIRSFEKASLMDRTMPKTALEAVYSIPYAVAAFLIHGVLGPQQLAATVLADPNISALSQRVRIIADPALTANFPEHCLQQIEVDFTDGTCFQSPVIAAKGDPDQPYSEEELVGKFRLLTEDILGPTWQKVPALLERLEQGSAVALLDALNPA